MKGLNIDDSSNGSRTTKGLSPTGEYVNMQYVNVHAGSSDNGNYNSRGSKGCQTIHPDDAEDFFYNFNFNGNTGDDSGKIYIYRGDSEESVNAREKLKLNDE